MDKEQQILQARDNVSSTPQKNTTNQHLTRSLFSFIDQRQRLTSVKLSKRLSTPSKTITYVKTAIFANCIPSPPRT